MLVLAQSLDHYLLDFIKDDPVRPEIPAEFRVSNGRTIAALVDEHSQPEAIVCVSFHRDVPASTQDLCDTAAVPLVAVFYTIWSYRAGSAAELLQAAVQWIRSQVPSVQRLVTLSPKTTLAHRFHIKNGAHVFRENADTINYEYTGDIDLELRTGT